MKNFFYSLRKSVILILILCVSFTLSGQSYLIGPTDPSIGTSASYTSYNHFQLFDVLAPTGVIIDSVTIYPTSSTAGGSYTVVVENSSQTVIASYSGVTTSTNSVGERVKVDLMVPPGTGYRLGLNGNPGMLRNSTGASYPYTVPGVMSFTGSTFQQTYWYFFYNIRIMLPPLATDIALLNFGNIFDSVCSGNQDVSVLITNNGPHVLTSAKIDWKVNNISQPVCNWVGNLNISDSGVVTIGNYPFQTSNLYEIEAFVTESNNGPDTINNLNDTISASGVYAKPRPSFTPGSLNYFSCSGDSVYIDGTLSGIPPWDVFVEYGTNSFSITNITSSAFGFYVTPNTNTTYRIVSVFDGGDCPNIDTLEIAVEVVPSPSVNVTLLGPPVGCEGDIVPIMASTDPSNTRQWYRDGIVIPGATNNIYNAEVTGEYQVKVTDTIGCSTMSQQFDITLHPAPFVFIGNDTNIAPGASLMLDAGAGFNSYMWSTGAASQTITIDSSGVGLGTVTIWVEVTDHNNCPGRDSINVTFVENPGIAVKHTNADIKIYPNPNEGVFALQLPEPLRNDDYTIEILDTRGSLLKTEELAAGEYIHSIDLSSLQSGLYYLRMKNVAGLMKVVLIR
ncbi:MAG: T9SS type A sorting domain-containing protein [Bacteroidales bacterium]|nr:T9SS type A sorting domain-containing protein [Bacteroidales bacterium]